MDIKLVDVSRETHENIPEIFVEKFEIEKKDKYKLIEFKDIILNNLKTHQFVSRKDKENIWNRHIMDSLMLLFHVKHYSLKSFIDLGSGAGFPGIVISIVRPDIEVKLLERKIIRCNFLKSIKKTFDLKNAEIICKNAKESKIKANVVVSRAVANQKETKKILHKILTDKGLFILYQNIETMFFDIEKDFEIQYILPNEKKIRCITSYHIKLNNK